MSWKQLVKEALEAMGGEGSLKSITEYLEAHPRRPQTATWQATIRRVVRQYKIFEPHKTLDGLAGYMLVPEKMLKPIEKTTKQDEHGKIQGMLLHIGMIFGYETYTNPTDKTIRIFKNISISEYATIRNDDDSLSSLNIEKVRNIDVIWMKEDDLGLYPAYAFEVENSTKVKDGLLRLLRIPERYKSMLYIIGKGADEQVLYDKYISQAPFRQHSKLLQFIQFSEIEEFYSNTISFSTKCELYNFRYN